MESITLRKMLDGCQDLRILTAGGRVSHPAYKATTPPHSRISSASRTAARAYGRWPLRICEGRWGEAVELGRPIPRIVAGNAATQPLAAFGIYLVVVVVAIAVLDAAPVSYPALVPLRFCSHGEIRSASDAPPPHVVNRAPAVRIFRRNPSFHIVRPSSPRLNLASPVHDSS